MYLLNRKLQRLTMLPKLKVRTKYVVSLRILDPKILEAMTYSKILTLAHSCPPTVRDKL